MATVAATHPYEAQLRALLGAVDVRPPDAFLWFGRRDPAGTRAALAARLEREFFAAGGPRPARRDPLTAPDDGGEFVRALSQANAGRGAWETGWRAGAPPHGEDGDRVVVRADGLRLVAPAAGCRAAGPLVEVRQPKELRGWRPGAYIALGDTPASGAARVALFWNLAAAGAVTFVARLTFALNRAQVAFCLQLPDNPARYAGRDSAVLEVARPDFPAALALARPLLRTLGAQLREGAPALTKPLARGLAVAELPGDGRTFGAARCALLADALVAAGERRLRGADERLAVVDEHVGAAGLSLTAPYLEPGSDDAYARS